MSQIPLIHPIYLDIPMMVSFTAALQDGFSLETEVIEEKSKEKQITGDASGKIGLNNMLAVVAKAEGSSDISGTNSQLISQTRKESKSYTEASIAIKLYHQLRELKHYIFEPKDFTDFDKYAPGTLIEVGGIVEKNAVDTVIDCIDAINILSRLAKPPSQKKNSGKKGINTIRNQGSDPDLKYIRDILNEDRERTPISNIIMRCSQPENLNAIVTLKTENLRDLTLSELNHNNVRVIGKITRKVLPNERISSFENYGMSMIHSQILQEAFSSITKEDSLAINLAEVEILGPVIQILPLMIFV